MMSLERPDADGQIANAIEEGRGSTKRLRRGVTAGLWSLSETRSGSSGGWTRPGQQKAWLVTEPRWSTLAERERGSAGP